MLENTAIEQPSQFIQTILFLFLAFENWEVLKNSF